MSKNQHSTRRIQQGRMLESLESREMKTAAMQLSVEAPPVQTAASYIKFDGIDGESAPVNPHGKWSDLESFSGNATQRAGFGLSEALLLAKVADIVDSRIRRLADADRQAARTESNLDNDVA